MKITVAVDIMGGDNPPSELAKGAVDAAIFMEGRPTGLYTMEELLEAK